MIFDAPTRDFCVAVRQKTSTPLQSLALMNDPQYLLAAEHLSNKIFNDSQNNNNEKIIKLYRTVTGRKPNNIELDKLNKFLNEEGYLKDAELFHRAIAIASNPDKFAKFFYEKGMADTVDTVSKESKNIDMVRQSTQVTKKTEGGFQVRAVEPSYGNRLVIKQKQNTFPQVQSFTILLFSS